MMTLDNISIHTPARGVTPVHIGFMAVWEYFNPHSRKGSDKDAVSYTNVIPDFNPHSRKGSDVICGLEMDPKVIFQSTLPQGE
jgi:hypothetical protein